MIECNVVQISKDGTKMRVNLQFWVHLGKYSKNTGQKTLPIFVVRNVQALLERRQKKEVNSLTNWISALFKLPPSKSKSLLDRINLLHDTRSDLVHEGIDNVDVDITCEIFTLAFQVIIQLIPYVAVARDEPELRKKLYAEVKAKKRKSARRLQR